MGITFKGFSTINQDKKFRLVDFELIKRDLLNSFLIREGTMPGRPDVGTNIWAYVFEPNDENVSAKIKNEVTRLVEMDPRLQLDSVNVKSIQNSVLVEVNVVILPDFEPAQLLLNFNEESQTVTIT